MRNTVQEHSRKRRIWGAVRFLSIATLVMFAGATTGFPGHAFARERLETASDVATVRAASRPPVVSATVRVKLLIWAKKPGTVTGMKMLIAIDSSAPKAFSNIDEQMLLDLGDLAPGIHQFSLTAITGYSVDGTGAVSRVTDASGQCSAQFVVLPFQSYYYLNVVSPDYKAYQCQIL